MDFFSFFFLRNGVDVMGFRDFSLMRWELAIHKNYWGRDGKVKTNIFII